MKKALLLFAVLHSFIAILFVLAALLLLAMGIHTAWVATVDGLDSTGALGVIEAMGLVAVAVVALQIAQTIAEEEVARDANVSGPTRVRRFLSRFLVVVVVAVAIEGLVATFKASHEAPEQLTHAASILIAVAFLLAGWGVFIKFNVAAEELEPEALEKAKSEDHKVE
jgi:quinol-cytochrome oxidoreductase complex cytochrome b subunit